jgi:predicted AAA+ superfamily ATPase
MFSSQLDLATVSIHLITVRKILKNNVTNYVFIDEVQNVKEFEKLLEGLYVDNLVAIVPIFPEKERRRFNGDYKKLLPLLRMGRLESLAGCNN